MKKKTIIIVAVIIVIAMLAGIIIPLASKKKAGKNADGTTETAASEETDSRAQETEEAAKEEEAAAEEPSADDTKEEQEEEGSEEESAPEEGASSGEGGSAGGSGGSGGTSGNPDGGDDSLPESQGSPSGSSEKEESTSIPQISFPYAIPGTDLVIEQIRSYNGIFIEDGSDSDVTGIAAIVLTNKGGNLEFAGIGISQGDRSLAFTASMIPAGATIILQAPNKEAYSEAPYYSATATTRKLEQFEMSEKLVTVKDNGNNTISVTNISNVMLKEVTIYYKNYLPGEDVYVGGITYNIKLNDLEPDTVTEVSTFHYDSEYSVIVEVQTERTVRKETGA